MNVIQSSLRFVYYLLYQPFAWTYDGVAALVSAGQWQSWVLSALDDLPGPRVLELGYGPGHLQVALHQKGLFTAGVDRSPQMSRQAARRLRKLGLPLALTRANAQSLPFPPAAFDQAVSTFPSEYAFDPATLAEVSRVLVPGGRWNILLSAYPRGRSLLHAAARLLLRADGQIDTALLEARLAPLLSRFREHGFAARFETRRLGQSETLWVIAAAPPDLQQNPPPAVR